MENDQHTNNNNDNARHKNIDGNIRIKATIATLMIGKLVFSFTWNEYLLMMQHLPQLHDKDNGLHSSGRVRVFRE